MKISSKFFKVKVKCRGCEKVIEQEKHQSFTCECGYFNQLVWIPTYVKPINPSKRSIFDRGGVEEICF